MGVQILNKDVSVISSVIGRAKAGIGSIWGATGWGEVPPGGDVIPNPTPNWTDINYDGVSGEYMYSTQQIQGISTNITLTIYYDDTSIGTIWHYVGASSPEPNGSFQPSAQGSISGFDYYELFNAQEFTVSNNDYVSFGLESNASVEASVTVTIKNTSDGNTQLDTFNAINFNII